MPDINFLSEDFKKREEKERHRPDRRSKGDEVSSMHVPTDAPHTIDFAKSLEKKSEQPSVAQKGTSPFASVTAPVSGALTPTPQRSLKTWLNRVVAKMRPRVSEEPARILEQRVVSRPPAPTATVPQKTSSSDAQRASFSKVAKNEPRQDTQELVSVPQLPHSEGDVVVNLLPEQQVLVEQIRKNVWLVILAGIGTAIIIVCVWGVIRWEKNRAWVEYASLAADIDRIKEESAGPFALSPDEVSNITRLGSVQELLAKRFLWTAWFSKVELSTLPQVSLEFMQARDNHISMRVIAPDWVTAAQQLRVWYKRSTWWTELKVSNSTFAPRTSGETDATAEQPSKAAKEVNYDIDMTLSEDAWKP